MRTSLPKRTTGRSPSAIQRRTVRSQTWQLCAISATVSNGSSVALGSFWPLTGRWVLSGLITMILLDMKRLAIDGVTVIRNGTGGRPDVARRGAGRDAGCNCVRSRGTGYELDQWQQIGQISGNCCWRMIWLPAHDRPYSDRAQRLLNGQTRKNLAWSEQSWRAPGARVGSAGGPVTFVEAWGCHAAGASGPGAH